MKVLVVEDDPALQLLYRVQLEAAGIDVTVWTDAFDKLLEADAWQHLDMDAVLFDFILPGVTGGQLLLHLKACRPEVRAVVVTARNEDHLDPATVEAADVILRKPTSLSVLLEALRG